MLQKFAQLTMALPNLSQWLFIVRCFLVVFFATSICTAPLKASPESHVQTISLHANKMTTSGLGKPIPQIRCSAGACRIPVYTVQCYNDGINEGNKIKWNCITYDLESPYKMANTRVSCEQFNLSKDKQLLISSCGLEYTIEGGMSDLVYYSVIILGIIMLFVVLGLCIWCGCNKRSNHPPLPLSYNDGPRYYDQSHNYYYGGYGYRNRGYGNELLTGYLIGQNTGGYRPTYSRPYSSGRSTSPAGTRRVTGFGGTTRR